MDERVYTLNLRRGVLMSPRWKKSDDSVAFVRNFLRRHMKTDDIKIESSISEKIWEGGNQKIPGKIRIKVVKDDDNKVTASLFEPVTPAKTEEMEKEDAEKKNTL